MTSRRRAPGKKGRPRKKGDRLPSLAKIAAAAQFSQVTVTRYGKAEAIAVHVFTCLWYSRHRPGAGHRHPHPRQAQNLL
jgi:hypothetical protein